MAASCLRSTALLIVALAVLGGCQQTTSLSPEAKADLKKERPPSAPIPGPLPASITEAYQGAEQLFAAVSSSDWAPGAALIPALKHSLVQVRADLNPVTRADTTAQAITGKEDQIDSSLASLEEAIRTQDRDSARRGANTLTMLIAELAGAYADPVPGELMMLKYYRRQFDIGASLGDTSLLTGTVESIRQTWDGLRPAVEAHGGTTEAQRFNDLVNDLEKSGGRPGQLPAELRDRIDDIQEVFRH